jgi:hypothetical protein
VEELRRVAHASVAMLTRFGSCSLWSEKLWLCNIKATLRQGVCTYNDEHDSHGVSKRVSENSHAEYFSNSRLVGRERVYLWKILLPTPIRIQQDHTHLMGGPSPVRCGNVEVSFRNPREHRTRP